MISLGEFARFIRTRKNYWIVPFFLALLLAGGLIAFSQSAVVSAFVYPLF